ncbi:phosphoglycerate mutase family protein [Egibacter rhizosphaerae]|uniref:phosphoglycerate mutase family protein n=1 Tax=Egibacter rhizosphaerae TaxID=1670831 RepID=UPI0013F17D42|nr:phosphoglycerate mutase family protein [Egibacter rhizosphaerae]
MRHAKAVGRRSWTDHDESRPLDAGGRGQAKWLSDRLASGGSGDPSPLSGVRTSPLTRCVETVELLGQLTDAPVVTDRRLADRRIAPPVDRGSAWVGSAWLGGRALAAVDELVRSHARGRVVVCSHGDVLATLLAVLVGRDGVAVADARVRKGAWVTLTFAAGICVEAVAHEPAPKG